MSPNDAIAPLEPDSALTASVAQATADVLRLARGLERSEIYFDHNASTPLAVEARVAMLPLLVESFGNPSSSHWASRSAAAILTQARQHVAELIGASGEEIVFTSGGSESNNAAIKGALLPMLRAGKEVHIVLSAVEHPSVTATCDHLREWGASWTIVPVDRHGHVTPEALSKALRAETALVSVMHANNEVGTVQPIAALSAVAKSRGALFHCDAAQSAGKIPIDVDDLGVDLLTLAGHKLYAPKGIGVLYQRDGVVLEPLIHGGGHEAGRRAGTEGVALAAGLGAACKLALANPCAARLTELRDQLWRGLRGNFGEAVVLNGHPSERLPNTLNVSFPGQDGAAILGLIPELAASTGSACHEGKSTISPVLAAMGIADDVARGAIRLSLGRDNDAEQVGRAVLLFKRALAQLQ